MFGLRYGFWDPFVTVDTLELDVCGCTQGHISPPSLERFAFNESLYE